MAFRPSGEFDDTLETGLFVQARCLEVVGRNPYPQGAARGGLRDKCIEQLPAVAKASIGFVDPHQRELGNAGPGITGGDPDDAPLPIPQGKDEGTVVVTAGQPPIVVMQALLDGIKLGGRQIVLGPQARGHQIPPYQS